MKRVDRIAEIIKKLVLAEEEEEESQLQVPFRSLSILRFLLKVTGCKKKC